MTTIMRADAARNQRAILQSAARVLGHRPDASMQAIARVAGLHRTTLYRHYPTRQDLVAAIHRQALDDAERAVAEARPADGSATDAVGRAIAALTAVGDRYLILAHEREPRAVVREREDEVTAPLVALIERGQRDGEFRDDLPAVWLASTLWTLLAAGVRASAEEGIGAERAADRVRRTLLHGMRVSPTSARETATA